MTMESYENIFLSHDGFVSNKWVHYFFIYDKLFYEYRKGNQPLTLLEIGVNRGGSLEIWKKYLPEGSMIHGVDINPKCKEINFSKNIFFHLGNAADRNFMEKTFKDIEFNVIIDDGSHICSEVIETFKIMFPKIKNGGLYVVEDLHTSYWKNYGGGIRKKGTSIEYFKNIVEALNADYIRKLSNLGTFAKFFSRDFRDKIKHILKINVDKIYFNGIEYSKTIESITFYSSICAIKKFSSPKNNPFISCVSGEKNIDGVNYFKNEKDYIQNIKNTFGK